MGTAKQLIAREYEAELLKQLVAKKEAQPIALYGRRRVGKTFLVRSLFKDSEDCSYFETTELNRGPRKKTT